MRSILSTFPIAYSLYSYFSEEQLRQKETRLKKEIQDNQTEIALQKKGEEKEMGKMRLLYMSLADALRQKPSEFNEQIMHSYMRADAEYQYGVGLLLDEQYEKSESKFKTSIKRNPHEPKCDNALAIAYWRQEDLKKTLGYIESSLEKEPNQPLIQWLKKNIFSRSKDAILTTADLKKLDSLMINPKNIDPHLVVWLCYLIARWLQENLPLTPELRLSLSRYFTVAIQLSDDENQKKFLDEVYYHRGQLFKKTALDYKKSKPEVSQMDIDLLQDMKIDFHIHHYKLDGNPVRRKELFLQANFPLSVNHHPLKYGPNDFVNFLLEGEGSHVAEAKNLLVDVIINAIDKKDSSILSLDGYESVAKDIEDYREFENYKQYVPQDSPSQHWVEYCENQQKIIASRLIGFASRQDIQKKFLLESDLSKDISHWITQSESRTQLFKGTLFHVACMLQMQPLRFYEEKDNALSLISKQSFKFAHGYTSILIREDSQFCCLKPITSADQLYSELAERDQIKVKTYYHAPTLAEELKNTAEFIRLSTEKSLHLREELNKLGRGITLLQTPPQPRPTKSTLHATQEYTP